MTFGEDAHAWIARSLGVTTRQFVVTRLKGSTSSSVFLVRDLIDQDSPKFVLRVLDNREWLADEPDLATHEAAALEEARKAGVRAPILVAFSSSDVGFGAPVVLMSHVEGKVELRPSHLTPWFDRLANTLASIHRHRAEAFPWRFRSWAKRDNLAPPEWATVPRVWEHAIDLFRGREPDDDHVFIHRDYHATNVLWADGRVSGVVDWINACRGPAGVDVAHCRTNLALMLGPDAADAFLIAYGKVAKGYAHNSYWDVDSIIDGCLPEPSFYEPWREFGLRVIDPETLKRRIERHLARVVSRA